MWTRQGQGSPKRALGWEVQTSPDEGRSPLKDPTIRQGPSDDAMRLALDMSCSFSGLTDECVDCAKYCSTIASKQTHDSGVLEPTAQSQQSSEPPKRQGRWLVGRSIRRMRSGKWLLTARNTVHRTVKSTYSTDCTPLPGLPSFLTSNGILARILPSYLSDLIVQISSSDLLL